MNSIDVRDMKSYITNVLSYLIVKEATNCVASFDSINNSKKHNITVNYINRNLNKEENN